MTADERLDQLEPLLAQTLAESDRHTAQLKHLSVQVQQLGSQVQQLATLGAQQSDNIGFLLRKVEDIDVRQQRMEVRLGQVETNQHQMDGKLDHIIGLLTNPGK